MAAFYIAAIIENHSQSICGNVYFLCEKTRYGQSTISFFQGSFIGAGGIFISGGGEWALGDNSTRFWDVPDIP